MKMPKLILSLIVLSLFCLFSLVPSVSGLEQGDILLDFDWEEDTYYQGVTGSVRIEVENDSPYFIRITWIGIHFRWQETDMYYRLDLESNPREISSQGTSSFKLSFAVASDTTIGYNRYSVRINYDEFISYYWESRNWDSGVAGSLLIHDSYEKTFFDLDPAEKLTAINSANNKNYQSPEARALIVQAENAYLTAQSYANQGQWQDAITQLQTIPNLLAQAEAKEETYLRQQSQFQTQILLLGGLGIGVAVVVFF